MPNLNDAIKGLNLIFDNCEISKENREKIINKLKTYETSIINIVTKVISDNVNAYDKLNNLLSEVDDDLYHNYLTSKKVLIILHPTDTTMFRVFPEIKLGTLTPEEIKHTSVFNGESVFKDFMDSYKADMAVPHRALAWETEERCEKRLNKYVDLSIANVLTNHVGWNLNSAAIRDFATDIEIARKPLSLSFAETAEDYSIMYGPNSPNSCMSATSGTRDKWAALTAKGLCPGSFYHYFPYTQGVYIKKGKTIVARTILYHYPDKPDKKYYGRIYTTSTDIKSKFVDSLEQAGFRALDKHESYTTHGLYTPPKDLSFTIPGVPNTKGSYVMPWPYFDNMEYYGKGFYASFNSETKEFTVTYKGKDIEQLGMLPVNVQYGVVDARDCVTQVCCVCNKKLTKNRRLNGHNGELFCGQDCAHRMNYHMHINIDGTSTWQPFTEHSIRVKERTDILFTTMEAALSNGYYGYIEEDILPEEGDIIVTSDTTGMKGWSMKGEAPSFLVGRQVSISGIPIKINKSQKTVIWASHEAIVVYKEEEVTPF